MPSLVESLDQMRAEGQKKKAGSEFKVNDRLLYFIYFIIGFLNCFVLPDAGWQAGSHLV